MGSYILLRLPNRQVVQFCSPMRVLRFPSVVVSIHAVRLSGCAGISRGIECWRRVRCDVIPLGVLVVCVVLLVGCTHFRVLFLLEIHPQILLRRLRQLVTGRFGLELCLFAFAPLRVFQ